MSPILSQILKCISIPIVMLASIFSSFAAGYAPLVNIAIAMGAIFFVQRAAAVGEYFWAAGFTAIVVVASPLLLVVKIGLLLGIVCIAACARMVGAIRMRPVRAV